MRSYLFGKHNRLAFTAMKPLDLEERGYTVLIGNRRHLDPTAGGLRHFFGACPPPALNDDFPMDCIGELSATALILGHGPFSHETLYSPRILLPIRESVIRVSDAAFLEDIEEGHPREA